MSERLQDLERAVTSGTAADGDGSTTSKRSLSVSMTRKPSLIIRRTLSSFRWALRLCACCTLSSAQWLQRDMTLVQLRKGVCYQDLQGRHAAAQFSGVGTARYLRVHGVACTAMSGKETCGPASCRRRTSDASQRLIGGDMSRAASIAGFEDPLDDDNDCGICLEADLDVAINGCKHRLCIDCSIRSGCLEALCLSPGAILLHAWHAVFPLENDWAAPHCMPLMGTSFACTHMLQ